MITELGLNYHLLTPYTSFIAVDPEITNPTGESTTRNTGRKPKKDLKKGSQKKDLIFRKDQIPGFTTP